MDTQVQTIRPGPAINLHADGFPSGVSRGHTISQQLIQPLRLLVLQPTPFCNISCDYCYLQDRANSRRMSTETVDATANNVRSSGLLGAEVSVIWHAGEPLTAPISFYRDSFRILDRALAQQTRVTHCIQTNGILIDEKWCELFAEWDVQVGVSLDGPASIHDSHRKTRSGRPTHHLVMAGIEQLRKYRLPFHVIAVVTRESLNRAAEIIEFFVDNGVSQVGFNIDEAEGANSTCSVAGRTSEYQAFMNTALRTANQAARTIEIREIANAERIIAHGLPDVLIRDQRVPYNSQALPGVIISVDHEGGFTTYSPELLDQTHPKYGSFVLGNIATDSIRDALNSEKALRIQDDIFAGVDACRRTCEFFRYCGGGAPVNKLTENGSFETSETVYCQCTVQVPFLAALESLEKTLGHVG